MEASEDACATLNLSTITAADCPSPTKENAQLPTLNVLESLYNPSREIMNLHTNPYPSPTIKSTDRRRALSTEPVEEAFPKDDFELPASDVLLCEGDGRVP